MKKFISMPLQDKLEPPRIDIMSGDFGERSLLQLKIDYLAFMEQVHGALGFESNLIAVLFSLLVESDYITQDRIMELTGLGRSIVSETLKKLTDPSSSFPVLVTRRPGDRRKYYYCPLGFNEYVMTFFTSATSASDFSEEICRETLARLDALGLHNRETRHFKRFISYLLEVVVLIQDLLEYVGKDMERYLKEPGYTPRFTEEDFEAMKKECQEPHTSKLKSVENDSLLEIKRDYIKDTLDKAAPIGRRREIGAVSLALILSADPVTQEEVMEVTGYSRSTVSENLARIEELNVLNVVKKPGDRKKYYRSVLRLEGYGTQKFQIQRGGYSQIVRMIEERFLHELGKIPGTDDERERLEKFFRENIKAYGLIIQYITFLSDFMLKRAETFEVPLGQ
jgi:DNA-binding transcriptional regulator GbsR (MarR family)